MEFNEQDTSQNSIISLNDSSLKLAHLTLKIPCFVSPNYHTELGVFELEKIDKTTIFPLITPDEVSLVLIGTGAVSQFLPPKQLIAFAQLKIGVESMNSAAACRSFNLLLSERRSVGLWLLG